MSVATNPETFVKEKIRLALNFTPPIHEAIVVRFVVV